MSVAAASATITDDQRDARAATGTRLSQRLLLSVVAAELILLYAPTVAWLVDRWTLTVWHNAHGFLIPPAVAWYAWQELRPLRGLPRTSSAWGLLFLVPALLMHVLDTGIHSQILSAASIVVALPGLSLLFLGTARTKAIGFPLAFAVFMLPIPLAFTEPVQLVLRRIATVAASEAVPFLGITVFAEGTSIHLREGVLLISDACSGFSTLYAACAVAALSAYTCNVWRRRIVTLAAAVPIAIASNIIRVILLVLVVRWLGMPALDTWLHPASGMMTFALSLPLIFWLGRPAAGKAVS